MADWYLENARERHETYPDSFWIPPAEWLEVLRADDQAQLLFVLTDHSGEEPEEQVERMWVQIADERDDGGWCGRLVNEPVTEGAGLELDDRVCFSAEHVMGVIFAVEGADGWARVPTEAIPEHFARDVAYCREAWTLEGAKLGEQGAVPLWTERVQAEAERTEDWADLPVRRIELDELLAELEGLDEVVLPTGRDGDAMSAPGARIAEDIREQLRD